MKCIIHIKSGTECKVTDKQATVMVNTGQYMLKRGINDTSNAAKPALRGNMQLLPETVQTCKK